MALEWCSRSLGGAVEVLSNHGKQHADHESSVRLVRLRSGGDPVFLKVHETAEHFERENDAYTRGWAASFGSKAPALLSSTRGPPPCLLITSLPGRIVESFPHLAPEKERSIYMSAGECLVALHSLVDPRSRHNVAQVVSSRFSKLVERARAARHCTDEELATCEAALALTPKAFAGEASVPCHRDYCAANWLADDEGKLAGVIDFEFSQLDARASDMLCRDPSWSWLLRPDLEAAFFSGYSRAGGVATPEEQLLVLRAEYSLGAIVWGKENEFFGFEREGRTALAALRQVLTK